MDLKTMSWALALGTDIGGNGTPIGASANVVGTAIAEREGYPVSWGRYCKYAYPAMMLVILLCNILLVMIWHNLLPLWLNYNPTRGNWLANA